jgi:hypothetical protein
MQTSKSVVVIDTSILCVWLKIAGLETCGPDDDRWDFARVHHEIERHVTEKKSLILPLTTLIETGNHIAQATQNRHERATELAKLMTMSAEAQTPWAAFSEQLDRWTPENLKKLAEEWPPLAAQKMSIGDATIKDVADYYAKMGCSVTLLTGDKQLAAYQPAPPTMIPRRRS